MTKQRQRGRGRRQLLIVVLGATLGALAVIAIVVPHFRDTSVDRPSRVVASSTAEGYSPLSLIDANTGTPNVGWRATEAPVGTWVQEQWDTPQKLGSIVVRRSSTAAASRLNAVVDFSDGSRTLVALPRDKTNVELPFTPRSATSFRLTFTSTDDSRTPVTLLEVRPDSPSDDSSAVFDHTLNGDSIKAAVGMTAKDAALRTMRIGIPSQLRWNSPRELVALDLRTAENDVVERGLLEFDDGTTVPLGAISGDIEPVTRVAFAPRSARSVSITLFNASNGAPVALTVAHLWEVGSSPPPAQLARASSNPLALAMPCSDTDAPESTSDLTVLCPLNGATVESAVTLRLRAAAWVASVRADTWSASRPSADFVVSSEPVGPGANISILINLSPLPAGPIIVRLTAVGSQQTATRYLQLVHRSMNANTPPPQPTFDRTLVYTELFGHPVTVTRSGSGAQFAAAKPVAGGVEDFGNAPFANPSRVAGSVGTSDGALRLSVMPNPGAQISGVSSRYLGALVSSARVGGSGFSAQYGYFEARMLAPAAAGTWPAFWLLPTPNLVKPTRSVAEIDAIELYGHDPTSGCSTTHQYIEGRDAGRPLCGRRFNSVRSALSWHVYAVDVRPTGIRFLIDGKVVARTDQVSGGDDPMFFLVDLALGGGWPISIDATRGRADLFVDYIRVYV